MKKRKKKVFRGALSTLFILFVFIMLLSLIMSLLDVQGYRTYISNGVLESSLVTVNNVFSADGFRYLFLNSVTNFKLYEPLVLLIISMIGISIADISGMLDSIFSSFKKVKSSFLTFIVVLMGVCITFFGSYSYVMLFPLIGIMYKKLGKSPILGLLTVFLGITIGYGTGIMFNYDSYVLGELTQNAARVDVDSEYVYSIVSTEYIMVVSTFIISFILTKLIENKIAPNFKKNECELKESKISIPTLLLFIFLVLLVTYMIIPGLPFSGILLDNSAERYIDKLFGSYSPFSNCFICIFSGILSICGLFYGYINGVKDSNIYSQGIKKSFDGLGYLFVLMFFISQLSGLIEWTNIGVVIGAKLIDFISNLQISGVLLIILFFVIIIFSSLLIPSTNTKWIISSPVVIPLFMRSNITPEFTQFIFQIADSVGKGLTPVYSYFIVLVGFMNKYIEEDSSSITISDTLKLTCPIVGIMGIIWILIIVLWYISGLPIGINGFSTL